ncbi:MAG: alkaline phosphatase D family protein [Henriciella sp.]
MVSFSLNACAMKRPTAVTVQTEGADSVRFPQGVGSADPQPNSVLLWTRLEPQSSQQTATLTVQVSTDEWFGSTLVEAEVEADHSSDYTIRAHIEGLTPDTVYYFRFITKAGVASRTGRTWTAPSLQTDRDTHVAYMCCQHYQFGFFGGYRRLINDHGALKDGRPQLDFILHLGDYIYENEGAFPERGLADRNGERRRLGSFPSGGEIGFRNQNVASTLDDYRHLYKRYLSDPDFQEARALFPFICVWDDHEFADDAWQTFSDGREQTRRRMSALQAWFEFVPAVLSECGSIDGVNNPAYDLEVPEPPIAKADAPHFDSDFQSMDSSSRMVLDSIRIYRSLRWGQNLDLILTDQRLYKSIPASLSEALEPITGPAQADILSMELDERTARILAEGRRSGNGNPPRQLTIRGKLVDNPRAETPEATVLGAAQKAWFKDCLKRSTARWKVWGSSSPLLRFGVDLSFLNGGDKTGALWLEDTWDGFPNERSELMSFIIEQGITDVLSLSGDRHLHAAGLVKSDHENPNAPAAIPDFAVGSLAMASRALSQERVFADLGHPGMAISSTHEGENGKRSVATLNALIRHGAHPVRQYLDTGDLIVERAESDKINPHLSFIDALTNGYGLVRFASTHASIELVGLKPGDVKKDWGNDGPPVSYVARFRVARWSKGEEPKIERGRVSGSTVFADLPH